MSKEKNPLIAKEEDYSPKENSPEMVSHLLSNARAAIFGAVELHNKPIFPNRYEVSIVLTINAWELLMKAYIVEKHPEKKIIAEDGTSLAFEKCVSFISRVLGKDFYLIEESLNQLYHYRCNIIHYYTENIELILYSLLRPNILLFADFINKHFDIDLAKRANLIILPIGFNRTISPVDFLSTKSVSDNEHVKGFVAGLVESLDKLNNAGIEDGLLCNYSMFLERENNPKHADIVIAFTKNSSEATLALNKVTTIGGYTNEKNAPKVQIDEVSLFKEKFNTSHSDFMKNVKKEINGFKETRKNMELIQQIKKDPNCFRWRLLDPSKPNGSRKGFYSEQAISKLKALYSE